MQPLVRGLTWPVVSLVLIGASHLVGEMVRPELHDAIGPAVAMPIYLVAGAWAAFGTIRAGGSISIGLVAAAILGLLPVGLQLIGFGLVLARDPAAVTTAALFGWLGVFWGGSLGMGLARGAAMPDVHP
ncbi:MAG: hypothetical protein HY263_09855 [Chloroflexi bacterium]|nr:hypothetical protein [Chloroflexota bacterium]